MKCDVVIPVFNAPEWVSICLRVLLSCPSNQIGKIIVIDDRSEKYTENLLVDFAEKSGNIELLRNDQNLGFVKSVNRGLVSSISNYILLLNSDCLITQKTIPKLIAHAEKDQDVGLISPISNNSPVVTYEMLPGYSYMQMDTLFEELFSERSVDACTIVGNCLLITRKCIEEIGYLDEVWGQGYGEESDYQFRAMEKGFKAKIAMDCYVFHKAEASFGSDHQINEHRQRNHKLFLEKWGEIYNSAWESYKKNDPIKYITREINRLGKKFKNKSFDVIFYLPIITQKIGGIHVCIEIVNDLILNNIKAMVVVDDIVYEYSEMMLFNSLVMTTPRELFNSNVAANVIAGTAWNTMYPAYHFAALREAALVYFVQGYETYFDNGLNYGRVAETYQMTDNIIVTSEWLKNKLSSVFQRPSELLPIWYDEHVFHPVNTSKNPSQQMNVTMVLRGDVYKGDWILLDIIRQLSIQNAELAITVIDFNESTDFDKDSAAAIRRIRGPLPKPKIAEILQRTDVFVDASLQEGFGLFIIEAMACGAVPVVSDSGGINQFLKSGKNGIIIKEINKPSQYVKCIMDLISNPDKLEDLKKNLEFVTEFRSVNRLKSYREYFTEHTLCKVEQQVEKTRYLLRVMNEEVYAISHSKMYRLVIKIRNSRLVRFIYDLLFR